MATESDGLRRVRAYIVSMPSLPTTVTKVLEVCNNPKTSPIDLDKVIQLDPVLMGRVLKLINSAYYGLGTQVTSLVRAIIMLGVNTVKNLALSTAVIDRVSGKNEFRALNMDGFWRHSLCVGVTAKLLAKRRGVDAKSIEEYFAAGLLHDIGKVPLNDALADDYLRAMSLSDREKISLLAAEGRVLGIDHASAGAIVAESWKLTGAIADTIAWHHNLAEYQGTHDDIIRTIQVADYYANREGIGFSGNLYPDKIPPETFEALGMERSQLEELDEPVNAAIDKAKIFLKLGG
jgi:putative nucleotidyltransferase with HDIG domain